MARGDFDFANLSSASLGLFHAGVLLQLWLLGLERGQTSVSAAAPGGATCVTIPLKL